MVGPRPLAFSLNDRIRFRPTAKGHAAWLAYWREAVDLVDLEYPLEVDADGWATEQLWLVMRVFGPGFVHGVDNPMDMEIEIPAR